MWHTDKTDLSTNGWSKWASERVDIIAGENEHGDNLSLVVQMEIGGGKNSMIHQYGAKYPENDSHSWRTNTTMVQVLDGFYNPKDPQWLKKLQEWQAENDKQAQKGGIFCDTDRRYLWGSYHRAEDKDQGASLDSVWDKYFDSREKYEKLVELKRKYDPGYVFTANMFGVDASNCEVDKEKEIYIQRREN